MRFKGLVMAHWIPSGCLNPDQLAQRFLGENLCLMPRAHRNRTFGCHGRRYALEAQRKILPDLCAYEDEAGNGFHTWCNAYLCTDTAHRLVEAVEQEELEMFYPIMAGWYL